MTTGAEAQEPSATAAAPLSTRYSAGWLHRLLLGIDYRDLWSAPLHVPLLDFDGFAGGLTPLRAGGGHQTRTLHLTGADGRRYLFRSVDKFADRVLPPDFQRTAVERLVQDQMSALHPLGALTVPPLLNAAGVLHVTPSLVRMPDHPRLAEHRDEFGGMVGLIEERPSEGEDDTPGFAGSRDVAGMERVLEWITEDPSHRTADTEYLAARLIDFLVGDTDRGSDQWRWARFDSPAGMYVWRPIPRDRDWAFIRSDGLLPGLARTVFPKLVEYGPDYPSLQGLVFSSLHLDRRILSGLQRASWDSVAHALRSQLSDAVIAAAVSALPPEHAALVAQPLAAALRARRDRLPEIATEFYELLAAATDVHATDAPDRADIDVFDDGSVRVSLSALVREVERSGDHATNGRAALSPYYERTFLPDETSEVRVYLLGGDDVAIVRGAHRRAIAVRVIAGSGDDLLVDSAGGSIHFYAAEGHNTLRSAATTHVDTRPFREVAVAEGWVEQKIARNRRRDWGSSRSLRPVLDFDEGAGLLVGGGIRHTRYGFAHEPYARRASAEVLHGTGGGWGVRFELVAPRENSPWTVSLSGRATRYERLGFYGYGNDTPDAADPDSTSLQLDRVRLLPALGWASSNAGVSVGARLDYTEPRAVGSTRAAAAGEHRGERFRSAAGWVEGTLRNADHDAQPLGVSLLAGVLAVPPALDVENGYGAAHGEARMYVTRGATVALRTGARKVWGDFPIHDAAFIGGRSTLRGYARHRFAGDAAIHGGAELRVPIGRAHVLVRGDLGVLLFAESGRVYVRGSSPGGWHTAHGAGGWFTVLGRTLAFSAARGEATRYYLHLGMPY